MTPLVLRCREIGWDCSFQATGPAPREVVEQARRHVAAVHHARVDHVRIAGWEAAIHRV